MIVYKIYTIDSEKFVEHNQEYFSSLLETIKEQKFLSPNITEIIITDDIRGEIKRYCEERFRTPDITISREFKAIAKTINFDGNKKVFFDAVNVNAWSKHTGQIFLEQILEIYADDLISNIFPVSQQYELETPFNEVIRIHFSQWATKVISNILEKNFTVEEEFKHENSKIFVDSFKRNIRKYHFQHQKDLDVSTFWTKIMTEIDFLIRRCLEVKFDNGTFDEKNNFYDSINLIISEIEKQTSILLNQQEIDLTIIENEIALIFEECFIKVSKRGRMKVNILDTPKKLFKNNLVDTELRIVAFMDILGFSAIIEEYDSDESSNILNELHDTLEIAIKLSIEKMIDPKSQTDVKEYLEYRMFSDCICISLPFIEFGNDFHIQFHSLSSIVKAYQLAMMQKGFFVRGGISIGSFYADKNMIFSGGLVKAYKLEQAAIYPIIAIDDNVIERLQHNFKENEKGLFIKDTMLIYKNNQSKIFLNPFDFLDNSTKYLNYLNSTLENLIIENEDDDPLTKMTNSLLKMTSSLTKPIFEEAKSNLSPETTTKTKEDILNLIQYQIDKHQHIKENNTDEKTLKEIEKVISKYSFLKDFTLWSLGKTEVELFTPYKFEE
ncbi:hypothetical protein ACYE2N_05630 [Flavobacterium sp. MAHUQ-51]|uniref:hypothetical protein n=1 Tax=Flavobacterium sp. GCM10022190 TaxID=3252639 RepID=UPI00360CD794